MIDISSKSTFLKTILTHSLRIYWAACDFLVDIQVSFPKNNQLEKKTREKVVDSKQFVIMIQWFRRKFLEFEIFCQKCKQTFWQWYFHEIFRVIIFDKLFAENRINIRAKNLKNPGKNLL